MNKLPKVLIVEDHRMLQAHFARELVGRVTLLQAHTVKEARQLFAEHPDIRVIVLDGCLCRRMGREPDTLPLIGEFRQIFGGAMIAMSNDAKFRKMMLVAGCTCEIRDKTMLPREIERLIER